MVLPLSLAAPAASLAEKRSLPIPRRRSKTAGTTGGARKSMEICFSCHGVKATARADLADGAAETASLYKPYMKRMTDDYMFAVVKFAR